MNPGHENPMPEWRLTSLCALLLGAQANMAAAQSPPAPESIVQAHPAWRFDPARRCPELRIADEGTLAVVVFHVNVSGLPSRASIKTSSGSQTLDAAAVSCVQKLRFQAATRLGDGVPIDSWQQIALRWARQPERHDQAPQTATTPATPAIEPRAEQRAMAMESPHPHDATVEMRFCADETGKLVQDPKVTRSSGDPALDDAALRIARAGSGYYRPAITSGATPTSGCVQLAVTFETK